MFYVYSGIGHGVGAPKKGGRDFCELLVLRCGGYLSVLWAFGDFWVSVCIEGLGLGDRIWCGRAILAFLQVSRFYGFLRAQGWCNALD